MPNTKAFSKLFVFKGRLSFWAGTFNFAFCENEIVGVFVIFTNEMTKEISDIIKSNNNYYLDCIEIKTNKNVTTLWLSGMATFRFNAKRNEPLVEISNRYIGLLGLDNDTVIIKDKGGWSTVAYDDKINEQILLNINEIFNQCYTDSAVDIFDCCHMYLECSDAKCCTHPDKKYARGCTYKGIMDNGRIFYGANRNID